jgi:hypothetical protein
MCGAAQITSAATRHLRNIMLTNYTLLGDNCFEKKDSIIIACKVLADYKSENGKIFLEITYAFVVDRGHSQA